MIMDPQVKELKRRSKNLPAILSIGKNGITQGSLELIKRELKQKKLIKIKFLKAALDQWGKDELIIKITDFTGASIIDRMGNNLVIYKAL